MKCLEMLGLEDLALRRTLMVSERVSSSASNFSSDRELCSTGYSLGILSGTIAKFRYFNSIQFSSQVGEWGN